MNQKVYWLNEKNFDETKVQRTSNFVKNKVELPDFVEDFGDVIAVIPAFAFVDGSTGFDVGFGVVDGEIGGSPTSSWSLMSSSNGLLPSCSCPLASIENRRWHY